MTGKKVMQAQQGERRIVRPVDIKPHPVVVTPDEREGVFGFAFKCLTCQLEFLTLSWRAHRPAEVSYSCPECGSGLYFLGGMTFSTRREFAFSGLPGNEDKVEISNLFGRIARLAEEEEDEPAPIVN